MRGSLSCTIIQGNVFPTFTRICTGIQKFTEYAFRESLMLWRDQIILIYFNPLQWANLSRTDVINYSHSYGLTFPQLTDKVSRREVEPKTSGLNCQRSAHWAHCTDDRSTLFTQRAFLAIGILLAERWKFM